ncbi:MAG TPA: hypothetical protein VIV60_14635 [Polyangiaceae bacterium]
MTNNIEDNVPRGDANVSSSADTAKLEQTATNPGTQVVIQELREKVTELPPEKHDEVHSVIDQIEEMIEKGPKTLATVETAVVGLVKYFPHLLPWLTNQADVIIRSLSGG